MTERRNVPGAANSLSRRQVMTGVATMLGGLAASVAAWGRPLQKTAEQGSTGAEGLLTYLHQEVKVPASPERIYEVLLDSKQFAAFTGMPAEINRDAGGVFSLFGGLIVGRNIELVANQRIVQAWRPAHWDPGVYSLAKFVLEAQGPQTKITLDHTGFPEGNFRHLNEGWYGHYWEPLRKYLS